MKKRQDIADQGVRCLLLSALGFCTPFSVFSGSPVVSFAPLTATTVQVSVAATATVQYQVTNNSTRAHTLIMMPQAGVTQETGAGYCPSSFFLTYKQSCLLALNVSVSQLPGSVRGGPVVCQQGPNGQASPFLCNQPSLAHQLNITALPEPEGTLYIGAANGQVYYSVDKGVRWASTEPPGNGSAVNSVFATAEALYASTADGGVHYSIDRGATWMATTAPSLGAVNGLFVTAAALYAASSDGNIYLSNDQGVHWAVLGAPDGSAVNGLFVASAHALYAGTANGYVYYSNDGGSSWRAINGSPDGTAVENIWVTSKTLYVNTANEFVYATTALTGGGGWSTYAQTVYRFFANADASFIDAGTQGGNVFSLSTGSEQGFVVNSPINSVFFLGQPPYA